MNFLPAGLKGKLVQNTPTANEFKLCAESTVGGGNKQELLLPEELFLLCLTAFTSAALWRVNVQQRSHCSAAPHVVHAVRHLRERIMFYICQRLYCFGCGKIRQGVK